MQAVSSNQIKGMYMELEKKKQILILIQFICVHLFLNEKVSRAMYMARCCAKLRLYVALHLLLVLSLFLFPLLLPLVLSLPLLGHLFGHLFLILLF